MLLKHWVEVASGVILYLDLVPPFPPSSAFFCFCCIISASLCFRAAADSPSSPLFPLPCSELFLAFFWRASSRWFPPACRDKQTMKQNKWHLMEQTFRSISAAPCQYICTKSLSTMRQHFARVFRVHHLCWHTDAFRIKRVCVMMQIKMVQSTRAADVAARRALRSSWNSITGGSRESTDGSRIRR